MSKPTTVEELANCQPDIFTRYTLLGKILAVLSKEQRRASILDVGCGPAQLIKAHFGNDYRVTNCDIENFNIDDILSGKDWLPEFDANSFDFVVCMDVLEHVHKRQRPQLIGDMIRWAEEFVIMGFPHHTANNVEAEDQFRLIAHKVTGASPKFLDEHKENRLPKIGAIRKELNNNGISFIELESSPIGNWLLFNAIDYCLSVHADLAELKKNFCRLVNLSGSDYISRSSAYRKFIVASKSDDPLALHSLRDALTSPSSARAIDLTSSQRTIESLLPLLSEINRRGEYGVENSRFTRSKGLSAQLLGNDKGLLPNNSLEWPQLINEIGNALGPMVADILLNLDREENDLVLVNKSQLQELDNLRERIDYLYKENELLRVDREKMKFIANQNNQRLNETVEQLEQSAKSPDLMASKWREKCLELDRAATRIEYLESQLATERGNSNELGREIVGHRERERENAKEIAQLNIRLADTARELGREKSNLHFVMHEREGLKAELLNFETRERILHMRIQEAEAEVNSLSDHVARLTADLDLADSILNNMKAASQEYLDEIDLLKSKVQLLALDGSRLRVENIHHSSSVAFLKRERSQHEAELNRISSCLIGCQRELEKLKGHWLYRVKALVSWHEN